MPQRGLKAESRLTSYSSASSSNCSWAETDAHCGSFPFSLFSIKARGKVTPAAFPAPPSLLIIHSGSFDPSTPRLIAVDTVPGFPAFALAIYDFHLGHFVLLPLTAIVLNALQISSKHCRNNFCATTVVTASRLEKHLSPPSFLAVLSTVPWRNLCPLAIDQSFDSGVADPLCGRYLLRARRSWCASTQSNS